MRPIFPSAIRTPPVQNFTAISSYPGKIPESILEAVEARNQAPSFVAINNSVENLVATGFTPPSWEELSRSTVEAPALVDEEPNQPRVGWQAVASREVESSFLNALLPTLSDLDIALLKSQGGPLVSSPFVSLTSRITRLEPQVLKVLFFRRLRLPLPLHSSRLPVRQCSRRLWPLPVGVCCGRSSRAQRVSSGKCSGKNLT